MRAVAVGREAQNTPSGLSPDSFWVKHSTFSRMLGKTKKFGLVFLGIPIAFTIGAILTLTEIALRQFLAPFVGKGFALINIIYLIGYVCRLGFEQVISDGNAAADPERTEQIKNCAVNIGVGYLHLISHGLIGNFDFWKNKSELTINKGLRDPIGIRVGKKIYHKIQSILQQENDFLTQLNAHSKPANR